MKTTFFILSTLILSSCGSLPQLYQTTEDIANDEAIQLIVSREAISSKSNVQISVSVRPETK